MIKSLYEKVPEVQASLPKGIHLVPYYEQAELVNNATGTVKRALLEGAILEGAWSGHIGDGKIFVIDRPD